MRSVREMAALLALLLGLLDTLLVMGQRTKPSAFDQKPPVECSGDRYITPDESCVNCTECPPDLIVIEFCHADKDTVCGPFLGFSFEVQGSHGSQKVLSDTLYNKTLPKYDLVEKSDMEHWRELAFSLIGVLCLLVVVATVIVFVTYARFLKYRQTKTRSQSSSERGEMEGEYVVIHRRPSSYVPSSLEEFTQISNGSPVSPLLEHLSQNTSHRANVDRYTRLPRRNNYRPQRRLLNEYVDDVFESDNSDGSRSSGIRGHLQTIPETPDGDV
ncbi:uncharacterized protein LOC110448451 [Mizuhopecten yessoensis]|uniref:TNFR-Cys domain-containing protein n=1 Tax=Mizuhopecten yessoensis TaxID=6573 RepID=A0A210QTA1_MIZYE|nr:uncharacterized protein LOC110448451 [Mizuhopecten yessoensis]OWF51964.1 hypothetical protein KP79_PYT18460 [Mizuhopecten yessoensis]